MPTPKPTPIPRPIPIPIPSLPITQTCTSTHTYHPPPNAGIATYGLSPPSPGTPAAALRNLYSHAPLVTRARPALFLSPCLHTYIPTYLVPTSYLPTSYLHTHSTTSKCRNHYIRPPTSQARISGGRLAKPLFGARPRRAHSHSHSPPHAGIATYGLPAQELLHSTTSKCRYH